MMPLSSHQPHTLRSLLLLLVAASFACSTKDDQDSPATSGGAGGTAGTGGTSSGGSGGAAAGSGGSSDVVVGTFTVALNPSEDGAPAFTTVFGKVYSGPYPKDVIETPVVSEGGCTVYKYSLHQCISPACTGAQKCAGPEDCQEVPDLVSVGAVTLQGLGSAPLTLSLTNNNYQYPLDLEYPGFDEGAQLSLSAAGGFYPGFTVTTTGVAPVTLSAETFELATGTPLLVEWEAGGSPDASVTVNLNISRHGGSSGYLECHGSDSGSLTIPAGPVTRLIELGVAGYPQLVVTRSTHGEVPVSTGKLTFQSTATAIPTLGIEGLCSCFDSSDCGSCEDTTKTVCDSVRKVCLAP
jgi:hypothetical protein